MKNESDGKVLFNEECSICNFEIKHYKKRSQLEYENCSQKGDKYLKALYVEFPDGREIKGVDAFIYVWSNTKGYGWLAKFASLPVIFSSCQDFVCLSCIHTLLAIQDFQSNPI
tara:strand:+ start:2057 stop:2395 length:339 start_codon:yes stop_codon:yes gene_type:complete